MLIIDAQVHIWGSGKPSGHHRQVSVYTAEELIGEMDAAGVNGADGSVTLPVSSTANVTFKVASELNATRGYDDETGVGSPDQYIQAFSGRWRF